MVTAYKTGLGVAAARIEGFGRTNEGGLAKRIDPFARLQRYLVLGAEGSTYYAKQADHFVRNVAAVVEALKADPYRVIDTIVEVSRSGRAPKNDPALVALAMAASYTGVTPEQTAAVRAYALAALPTVARTGTHLLHFVTYVKGLRGFGSGLRKGIARWYTEQRPLALAQQVTKYANRDGMSHRDVLRLAHPLPPTAEHDAIFSYVTQGQLAEGEYDREGALGYLCAVEYVKQEGIPASEVIDLINQYRLPREVLPTHLLKSPDVWAALLDNGGQGMPMTALVRNIATMTRVGLLAPGSDAVRTVEGYLRDEARLRTSRIHPLQLISAQVTYERGFGVRSDAEWTPVPRLLDALEDAFYLSFGNVPPTGKRVMLALDVSGSMTLGEVAGVPGLTPRVASAVMAMVTARVEPDHEIVGFSHEIVPLTITPKQRLDDVVRYLGGLPFGWTLCEQPIRYAQRRGMKIDGWAIYTDSETGGTRVDHHLDQYREDTGIDARMAVVGMVSNGFSLANGPHMLDVVGFDTAAPSLISEFIAGRV